jgi:putative multiple sugar transport system ATP-binding protein
VADAITVLRDGVTVATLDCHAAPPSQDLIIRHMVGREMTERYPRRQPRPGEPLFELTDWHVNHPLQRQREVVRGVSLSVRRGEIVGIAGLMGAGRTELAMSVFGRSWGHRPRGTVRMQGHEVDVSTVHKAIAAGIAYVTEDRKALGLVLDQSITRNTTLAHLLGVSRRGVLHEGREHRIAHDYRKSLQTRCATVNQAVGTLSGGNQQKVVLAKWLFANPQLLILDEPTRGIDVGAKFEIYTLMARLAEEGRGVLMISSELPELLGMCDRIYVMDQGRFVAELSAAEASQERILRAIVVGRDEAAHPGEALAAQASVAVAA